MPPGRPGQFEGCGATSLWHGVLAAAWHRVGGCGVRTADLGEAIGALGGGCRLRRLRAGAVGLRGGAACSTTPAAAPPKAGPAIRTCSKTNITWVLSRRPANTSYAETGPCCAFAADVPPRNFTALAQGCEGAAESVRWLVWRATCRLPARGYGVLQRLRRQRVARCQVRGAAEACQELHQHHSAH